MAKRKSKYLLWSKLWKLKLISINFQVKTRSDDFEKFLFDAYDCKPCSVDLIRLKNENIVRIIHELKVRSQSRLRVLKNLSPKSKRRDDSQFKPPVPVAIKEVEIETTVDIHYPTFDKCEFWVIFMHIIVCD